MKYNQGEIISVLVYLERTSTRQFVGKLSRDKDTFFFDYDMAYLKKRDIIPLGPELPLTRQHYQDKYLFLSFKDRLPSKENPAYPEYCKAMGISVDESDPFVLLTTIARRGPSSFVFEPEFSGQEFSGKDLKAYRDYLGLTVREFAVCFQFSSSALNRVENGIVTGSEILKRAMIYAHHPKIAIEQIQKHGVSLHPDKKKSHHKTTERDGLIRIICL